MSLKIHEVPEDPSEAPRWCYQPATEHHTAALIGIFADGDTNELALTPGLLNGETPVMVMMAINWEKRGVAPVGLFLPDLLDRDDITVEIPGIDGQPVLARGWRRFCEPFNAARKALAKAFRDAMERFLIGGGDTTATVTNREYGYGMYL